MKKKPKKARKTPDKTVLQDDAEEEEEEEAEASDEDGTLLQRLIARQSFDGSWTGIIDQLCDEMSMDRDVVRGAVQKVEQVARDTTDVEQALSTAVVVVFLENKMEDEEETWELVVEKARAWLKDVVDGGALGEVWREAKAILGV